MWFAACNKHKHALFYPGLWSYQSSDHSLWSHLGTKGAKNILNANFFRWLSLLLSSSVICQSALILLISVVKSTRSTQRAQTSLAEADHYSHIAHCKNVEPWWWKANPKGFGSLPAPRSGYATTIMVFFCSFTHLRIPRSPPKFNQFFIVLPRTPP